VNVQVFRQALALGLAFVGLGLSPLAAQPTLPPTPANYGGYFDLSDPATQSYVISQLNAAGLTASAFPSLFNAITSAQAIYQTADAKNIVIPTTIIANEPFNLKPVSLVIPMSNTSKVQATTTSVVPNDPVAVANTISLYTPNGTQVGTTAGNVNIGDIGMVDSTATGTPQAGISAYHTQGVNLFVYPASMLGSTAQATLGLSNTASVAMAQPVTGTMGTAVGVTTIVNTAPVATQVSPGVYETNLCFNRTGTNCTYSYPFGVIQMPQIGSVTFPSTIATDPTTGQLINASLTASISLPNMSVACAMDNTSIASQVTPTGSVLSWNINPAQFGAVCPIYTASYYGTTQEAIYNFIITVQDTSGNPMNALITTDPQMVSSDGILALPPMTFLWGCLAPGTVISMDGKTKGKKIETVQVDQMVRGPKGKGLKVSSYWTGKEKGHLIRIRTANKHGVDMSDFHPVPLVDGTVKLASNLKVGDVVTTESGPSKIVHVQHMPYDGAVWNLDLGPQQRHGTAVDMAEHAFYANGILVGDGRAQSYYSRKDKLHPAKVLSTLPEGWHRDYYNAQMYKSDRNLR